MALKGTFQKVKEALWQTQTKENAATLTSYGVLTYYEVE